FCDSESSVVCRILTVKGFEHFECRPHCAFLSISLCVNPPVGFRESFGVWRKCLPEVLEKEVFAPLDQIERNRTKDEMKMPERGGGVDLLQNIADTWNWRFKQSEFFDFIGILGSVSIGDHQADIVADKTDLLVAEAFYKFVNIPRNRLFV